MTQAYDRLAPGGSRRRAEHALEAAMAREPQGFVSRSGLHPELGSRRSSSARCSLLEVGEMDAAKRELAASGATAEGADPELTWVAAWLYDAAGYPDLGHAFARGKLTDFLAHYPVGRVARALGGRLSRAPTPRTWRTAAHASGIPAALVWAIMREESDFHPEAKSGASAYGLMQLVEPTAKMVGAKGRRPAHRRGRR